MKAKLRIKVRPQAGRTRIVGFHRDGALRVELAAPPERGKANQSLIALLSKETGLPKGSIRIVSGQTSRSKHVSFEGISEVELRERFS